MGGRTGKTFAKLFFLNYIIQTGFVDCLENVTCYNLETMTAYSTIINV